MRKLKLLLLGLLCTSQFLWAQTQIKGKVTDSKDGSPLQGVTVSIKNTSLATTTGPDGSFSINASPNAILQFSSVGFQTLEVKAKDNLSVGLIQGDNSLSEVIVVGYGTKLKRELTGSVARVSAKELANTPVTSFENALQG